MSKAGDAKMRKVESESAGENSRHSSILSSSSTTSAPIEPPSGTSGQGDISEDDVC